MAPLANTVSHPLPDIAGYTIVEPLYLGSRTAVYRAVPTNSSRVVVIKVLRREYPSFGELVQFRNQYTIAKKLPIPGVVQPISLESLGSGYVLVMEDVGGIPLGQYAQQQPLDLTDILTIAIQIAETLHDLCHHRVVHKDIKPANILIHPESKQVKLIDFSIASLLPKETQDIQNPNILEGTLAYLAPEQTGRMNRGIDYRADFYALGVTLYQLLTGVLPFQSGDPLELMHCHIAKVPTPIEQVNPDVPKMVSAIVTKLMAKNAEDRYQSAMGLKHDLTRCLTQWKELSAIVDFKLGERDLSDRFLIPEKLYGREAEVQTLLDAFDRVANGASELMLVAGFSGIGKTAVVNEVHKPITRQQGYFIKGKFDQFNRNIPLSAFVQALRDLMGQLLCESDMQLAQWQAKILAAVGENGQILIEVIPELEQIIGKQPPVAELSGNAAQNRFNRLFQQFIEVFTTAEHPLVMFLDDLQWADLASLQLVKLLMNDNGYLLMLGAYRDNEVSPAHPLILTVEDLKKAQSIVNTITLKPLTLKDTNALIADTLNCSTELAQPLTELIDRKTQGNPFFTTQFLKALHEENHITFNSDRRYWECDIAEVNALGLTDDVVEFMALQLQKLPDETQHVLKLAACVGNQFDLATLAIVSKQSPTDVAEALWKALSEGLILPTNQVYKFFQSQEPLASQKDVNPTYRFLHDRVQQAAYSLIPKADRATVHQSIGKLFLQQWSEPECHDRVFEIVNHLNKAIHLVTEIAERHRLAQLNLKAGQKAKATTAYQTALSYLELSLDLLPEARWQQHYDLTRNLHLELAMNACLVGDFVQTERWITLALNQIEPLLDQVPFYEIKIQALVAQNQLQEAIQLGFVTLQTLGIDLPTQPSPEDFGRGLAEINALLADRAVADLVHLPNMTETRLISAMRVLLRLAGVVVLGAPHLMPFIFFKMVSLSMQAGNTVFVAPGYATYGMILCSAVGDIETGYEFGQLALKILEEFPSLSVQAKTLSRFHGGVRHWKEHWRNILSDLQTGYQLGLETGDLETTAIFAQIHGYTSYFLGVELRELAQSMATYSEAIAQLKQPVFLRWNQLYRQHVLNLLGESDDPCRLVGKAYDETNDLPQQYAVKDAHGIAVTHLFKAIGCYLFENYEDAAASLSQTAEFHRAIASFIPGSLFYFYQSLVQLALYPHLSDEQAKSNHLDQVEKNQQKMQQFAKYAAVNWSHKVDLVAAQFQQVTGNRGAAIDLYDRAIAGAKANGYIQEEALANELAAKFYLNWGKEKVAAGYMQEAYYSYARWGAKAKVQDLERRYPSLLSPILYQHRWSLSATETVSTLASPTTFQIASTQSSSFGGTSISDALDLATVLKASQTLSSEIQLDKLLATLLHTVLENAGADKGVLLMPHEHHWFVEAVATIHQPAQIQSIALSDSLDLPQGLIHTVKRSLQPMVIVDAAAHPTLATDAYVVQQQPKSLLCTPILQQGKLVAILYLENHVTVGAFTSDRVELLNFLCAQAAISLENARFYAQEQEKSQQLQEKNHLLAFQSTISHIAAHNDDLFVMLQQFCQATVDHLDAAFARIWLLDTAENILELKASAGLYTHLNGLHQYVPVGKFKIGLIAQEKMPHLTNDVLHDPRISDHEWAKQQGMVAFAGHPLMLESELLGVVAMFARNPLSAATLESLQVVATEISLGIQRKILEISLEQKAIVLEQALQDLKNAQLQTIQSEKMASLGNLVAGVAHEINNPIGFLNGSINNAKDYVQDLLDYLALYQQHHPNAAAPVQDKADEIDLEFLSADLPKLLDSMKGATDRIKGISTSLRTFSRADTEHKVTANLHDGIDSTLLILKYRLKANEFRPAIEVIKAYGELPPVECFPGQLNQVLMNILANVIDMFDEMAQTQSFEELKANPQQITICTTIDANQVQIQIHDNGKGMNAEVRTKIFDHLFTTKGVGKGTGLGLAIARQIVVETHQGKLFCNSTPGIGTEFVMQLPLS